MSELRAELRKLNKSKLSDLSSKDLADFSKIISEKVISSDPFVQSQNIACYIPFEDEVDVWPIIKAIWQKNKNCYLPTVSFDLERHLDFLEFLPKDQLHTGKYKTIEPKFSPEKLILAKDLDLIIMPMIGYNRSNFRLGRGKGYYDFTFAFKKDNDIYKKPILVGVAYQCQQVEFVPNDWDIPVDMVITESA